MIDESVIEVDVSTLEANMSSILDCNKYYMVARDTYYLRLRGNVFAVLESKLIISEVFGDIVP